MRLISPLHLETNKSGHFSNCWTAPLIILECKTSRNNYQNQKNPKLKMHSKFYTKHFQMHATTLETKTLLFTGWIKTGFYFSFIIQSAHQHLHSRTDFELVQCDWWETVKRKTEWTTVEQRGQAYHWVIQCNTGNVLSGPGPADQNTDLWATLDCMPIQFKITKVGQVSGVLSSCPPDEGQFPLSVRHPSLSSHSTLLPTLTFI